MKRPLAGVLVGFTGGILLGRFLQPPPALLWGLVLALAPLAWGDPGCVPKLLADFLYRRLPSLLSRGFLNPQTVRQLGAFSNLANNLGMDG